MKKLNRLSIYRNKELGQLEMLQKFIKTVAYMSTQPFLFLWTLDRNEKNSDKFTFFICIIFIS